MSPTLTPEQLDEIATCPVSELRAIDGNGQYVSMIAVPLSATERDALVAMARKSLASSAERLWEIAEWADNPNLSPTVSVNVPRAGLSSPGYLLRRIADALEGKS